MAPAWDKLRMSPAPGYQADTLKTVKTKHETNPVLWEE